MFKTLVLVAMATLSLGAVAAGLFRQLNSDLLERALQQGELKVTVVVGIVRHYHAVAHGVGLLGALPGGGRNLPHPVGVAGVTQRIQYLIGLVDIIG